MEAQDAIQAKDFTASRGNMGAPLGYVNEFSHDLTCVGPAPLATDGLPMRFIWGVPQRIHTYKAQGVMPVPSKYFFERPPGGTSPLSANTASIYHSPEGYVYKENKLLQLFWTTETNGRRLDRIQSEANLRMAYGESKLKQDSARDEETLRNMGIGVWSEEKANATDADDPEHPDDRALGRKLGAKKAPAISLAGTKPQ